MRAIGMLLMTAVLVSANLANAAEKLFTSFQTPRGTKCSDPEFALNDRDEVVVQTKCGPTALARFGEILAQVDTYGEADLTPERVVEIDAFSKWLDFFPFSLDESTGFVVFFCANGKEINCGAIMDGGTYESYDLCELKLEKLGREVTIHLVAPGC